VWNSDRGFETDGASNVYKVLRGMVSVSRLVEVIQAKLSAYVGVTIQVGA
jgi:hypothetical protein